MSELRQHGDWLLKLDGKRIVYGFRVKLKVISQEQKDFEIKEIFRKTDELCGNRSGNEFIKNEIKYNG